MNASAPILPIAALALSLAACASSPDPNTEPTSTATPTSEPSSDPTSTPTSAPTTTTDTAPKPKADKAKVLADTKQLVATMARGVVSAYERETSLPGGKIGHALCKTATPVPAKLPSVTDPTKTSDADWSGDETTGWKCLKFSANEPAVAQFSYTAGSTPKLTARKLATRDMAFEACAEVDLDLGGKTTLVCATGKLDKAKQMLKLDTELQVDGE